MKRAIPLLATLALLGGCFTLPPGPPPDLSTPRRTLELLRDSYINLDYNGVLYTLDDAGDFVFAFDQREWGDMVNGHPIPIDWGIYSERIATQNMFYEAVRIEFDKFDLSELTPVPEGATHYSSVWIPYQFRYYYDVEDHSYVVSGNAQFELEKQGEDWIITRWSDQKVGEHSWGWLKFFYRY